MALLGVEVCDQYSRCHLQSPQYKSTLASAMRIAFQWFLFLLLLITAAPKSFPVLQEKDSTVQKVIMASGYTVLITFFHHLPCKQSCQLLALITRCTRFVSNSCSPSIVPTESVLTAQCPAFSLPLGCVWREVRKQEG